MQYFSVQDDIKLYLCSFATDVLSETLPCHPTPFAFFHILYPHTFMKLNVKCKKLFFLIFSNKTYSISTNVFSFEECGYYNCQQ